MLAQRGGERGEREAPGRVVAAGQREFERELVKPVLTLKVAEAHPARERAERGVDGGSQPGDCGDRAAGRSDLALSLAMTGNYDEALEILEPIARSADASPQDRQNLAFIYGLKGDRQAALTLSRVDLPEAVAQANVKYFETARRPPQR